MFAAGELALSRIILANLSLSLGFHDIPSWTRRRWAGPKMGSLRNANIAINLTALLSDSVSFGLALSCHLRSPNPSGNSLIRGPLNQHCGWTGHQTITCSLPLFVLLLVKDLFSAPVRSKITKCFKLICIWMCFSRFSQIILQKTNRRISAIFSSNVNTVKNVKSCRSWVISVLSIQKNKKLINQM